MPSNNSNKNAKSGFGRKKSVLTSETAPRKGASRKRLPDQRVAELLDVAAEAFIADGFAAASTNQIARRAGASKTTFYRRFPTKEDLFLAVIERRMTTIFKRVASFPEQLSLRNTLQQFCANLLRIALSPDQISLIRMVSMESVRYPALATRFYENGPKRAEDALATYISDQIAKRVIRREDPLVMARQLMNLISGSPVRWFVLGFDSAALSKRALKKHIDDTIGLFLRAYGMPHD